MLGSTIRNVVPCALSSRIMSPIRSISVGLMPPAGSSSMISRGSSISTRASSTSLCWPKDSAPPRGGLAEFRGAKGQRARRLVAEALHADEVQELLGALGLAAADAVGVE